MAKKKVRHIPPSEVTLDYARFGNAVRELIEAKGFYLSTVAEAVGLTSPYFCEQLRGKKRMQLDTYLKLLDVLDVSDVILISQLVSQKQIVACAPLIRELLSLINNMPEDILESFVGLAKQMVAKRQPSVVS